MKKHIDTILGIDRGASFTDFGVVKNNRLIETFSIEKRDWDSIKRNCGYFMEKYKNSHIVFTGSTAGIPKILRSQVQVISEIDAISFGGATLADCKECIVVSMGTGTAIVHFKNNTAMHVGGTGVGGGAIKGLSSFICGMDDPSQIEALALKGDASKINLTIADLGYEVEDLGYEGLNFLRADFTASNFASVKSKRIEDLAAAILRLVGETVGIIASISAREGGCQDKIVMVGKVAQNQYIRHTLNLVGKLYQTTFIFPEYPGYATVFGSVLKYQYDLART